MKVTSIQPTPNPNAFKFLMDKPMAKPGQTQAYAKPEQAHNDVLAQAMFAVPGVETLFFCDNFVTVSMTMCSPRSSRYLFSKRFLHNLLCAVQALTTSCAQARDNKRKRSRHNKGNSSNTSRAHKKK